MVEINWTKQSIKDIDNTANFIAQDSEKYASIQVLRFLEVVKILEKQPQAGKVVSETNKKDIRELVFGNYRIIYKIKSEKIIDILTIHHSKRLLSNNPIFKK